jgi:integrase
MARRVQAYVNRFFAWCVERDLLKTDLTTGMPRVGNGKSRDRVLSDAELKKVWAATDSIGLLGIVTRLLILTGARREEMTQLRWSEVEGDTITLKGDRTKNGKPHIIPLSLPARELLANMHRIGNCDCVFTLNGTKPIASWSQPKLKLDAVSGVTGWRIHDLRRTMATGCQKLGIPLQVTEAILGHTSGSRDGIVGVYQRHDYAAEKRAALNAWGAYVAALVRQ